MLTNTSYSINKSSAEGNPTRERSHDKYSKILTNEDGTILQTVVDLPEKDDANDLKGELVSNLSDQKFNTLKMSIRSFILSSDKLMKLVPRNTVHQQTTLEIYRNDKKMLENQLNRVFIFKVDGQDRYERFSAGSGNRSSSYDDSKRRSNVNIVRLDLIFWQGSPDLLRKTSHANLSRGSEDVESALIKQRISKRQVTILH